VYFGLLSILTQVGVAESEKRVAAIFLLPVWALEPPERSFLPAAGATGLRNRHTLRTFEIFKLLALFGLPHLGQ